MKLFLGLIFLFPVNQLQAQKHEVSGRVFALNNRPMEAVNVILKGTPNGTVTDMNGYFEISLPDGPVVLLFSFLKQKPLQHGFTLRSGFKYEINAYLADKTQTFHKSYALTAELPVDSPEITGRVADQNDNYLRGVKVTQKNSSIKTTTDAQGYFRMTVPYGENTLSLTLVGLKTLEYPLEIKSGFTYDLQVVLVEAKFKYRALESFAESIVHPQQLLNSK